MIGHQAKNAIDATMIFTGLLITLTLASVGRFAINDPIRKHPATDCDRDRADKPMRDRAGEDWTRIRDNTAASGDHT